MYRVRMSDGSCDIYVHRVMHLSPFLTLLLITLRPTNINMAACISVATYFVFVHSLSSTAVRFCSTKYGLTSYDEVTEDP